MKSPASLLQISLHITAQPQRAYFTAHQPHRLYRDDHYPAQAILLCHCFTQTIFGSAGISACCPSPTTSVLGLGPDLPWADEPSPGNLGLSTGMFLACLSLLIPAFSLVQCPPCLSIRLLPLHIAPLPRIFFRCTHRFGVTFSPGHLRRTITRPVSYYALFKCVAASEPTSWLSVQFHILLHLT